MSRIRGDELSALEVLFGRCGQRIARHRPRREERHKHREKKSDRKARNGTTGRSRIQLAKYRSLQVRSFTHGLFIYQLIKLDLVSCFILFASARQQKNNNRVIRQSLFCCSYYLFFTIFTLKKLIYSKYQTRIKTNSISSPGMQT